MTEKLPEPIVETPAVPAGPFRRFTLLPDGIIACQLQESNPLPGPSVARLTAGVHWMTPGFEIIAASLPATGVRPETMQEWLEAWLPSHIHETLPFTKGDENAPEGLRPLLAQVAEAGGIAERVKLTLPELTTEDRAYLRSKGLRLGPVHIYYQAILKPAPLTLRALLWATHQNMNHPLPYPRPGVTSYTWPDDVTPNAEIQHWFGYPLYARRACRVDRIDKIICDVYDSAQKGVFTFKNAWAEWLGCKVEDVCNILVELGHTRIETPVVEVSVPAEGEEAAKAPVPLIQFRLKSDRVRTERPKREFKPKEERKSRPEKNFGKDKEKSNVKKFDRPKKDGKPFEKREKKFGDETPLTASPFANLKDMLGR